MTSAPAELELAIARLEALDDAAARAAARAAVSALLDFHADGLRRLCERLREMSADGGRTLQAIAEDEVVASLLLLHGLHPLPLEARVRRALGKVRASDRGEGGRIEVLSVDDATIRLRVTGSEGLRRAVTRAVTEAAPEVERVEVLGPEPGLAPLEQRTGSRESGHERCELCGQPLASEHEHLFDVERRRLECACTACGLLFDTRVSKLRRVRRTVMELEGFQISEARWAALGVPVGLAFFSYSSSVGEVIAAYPGPAGAIESVVSRSAWEELVKDNRVLAELAPDVSALLVDRLSAKPKYHLLSIDECYRLTGIVRSRWQGLTGGEGPIRAVEEFFSGRQGGLS